MQWAACTGHEAWTTFQNHINGHCWRQDIRQEEICSESESSCSYILAKSARYSPCCSYSERKGEDRFQNGDAQDT